MMNKHLIAGMTALALAGAAGAQAAVTLDGRTVGTPGHEFELGDIGLPAQLEIRAAAADLPLSLRGGEAPSADALQAIGRGPQLSAPIRLEAVLAGEPVVAEAAATAAPTLADGIATVQGGWQAGTLRGTLALHYDAHGALTGRIRCEAGGAALERLELVIELAGTVDTALAGAPVVPAEDLLPVDYGVLATGPGVQWRNGPAPVGGGADHPGAIGHFFLGNGDRGFTWLTHADGTLPVADDAATVTVERTPDGTVLWRLALATGPVANAAEGGFTLLVHPARATAAGRRALQWQPWPDAPAAPALTAAARTGLDTVTVRADAGSVHEAFAERARLTDAAGGAARSATATLADRAPLALFRYLAGTHTALAAQLDTDASALVPAGGHPAADRMALGRVLLHDIGADLAGLSGRVEAAALLGVLERFGVFEDDGQTEFLPYWRTGGILRYGEAFRAGDGFEVTEENPAARARVSVYLRPDGTAGRRKALFVIVNESTHELREQLYLLQPATLFGGPNRLTAARIYEQLDFSRIPGDSDWRREIVVASAIRYDGGGTPTADPQLMDSENGGFVRSVRTRDETEVYGLIHIPARGMRVLFGTGL